MPSSHRDLFPSVDEKKALEQLERFQREIQSARWKREQAAAEFERFVKGFREEPEGPTSSGGGAGARPGAPHSPSVVRAVRRHSLVPPTPVQPQPAATPAEPAPQLSPQTTEPIASPSPSARLLHWRGVALIIAGVVVVLGLAIQWWRGAPLQSTRDNGATTAPAQQAAQTTPAPPAGSPTPATEPVAQHTAMLTTTGRVWVRVMADGHRAFERELPAGARVPLDAKQAIVIRAGDAGAVRLTFADGRTETLGATGQVVTKRFEVKR